MSRKYLFLTVLSVLGLTVSAQSSSDQIYVGLRGGAGLSWASYSELKNRDAKMLFGGVGGVFMEFEFGENRLFSIRPEVDWLTRGTKISDKDLDYQLKAKYVDVRLPLVFNFGDYEGVRPYLYVAPIAGFVYGGKISSVENGMNYKVDVSEANMSNTYIAGAVGAGVKVPIRLNGNKRLQFALEVNYQHGFTDTFADSEKSGEAIAVNRYWYDVRGSRKLHGLEITASLAVPLSLFKRAPKKEVMAPVYVPPVPVVVKEEPVVEEKPCYTLEEIMELLGKGESITGKTICAIDIINFEFDRSVIKKESYPYLDKIVMLMKNMPIHVVVRGHTDNVGDPDYNMELSKKRAEAVYNYLLDAGVDSAHLSYEYYGMTQPITTNDTPEGRLMNRRVEFEITE